jgi:hypothetical protein
MVGMDVGRIVSLVQQVIAASDVVWTFSHDKTASMPAGMRFTSNSSPAQVVADEPVVGKIPSVGSGNKESMQMRQVPSGLVLLHPQYIPYVACATEHKFDVFGTVRNRSATD